MYRVKNKNKYIEKNCASRWSFTKNHFQTCCYCNSALIFYKTTSLEVITLRNCWNYRNFRKSETPFNVIRLQPPWFVWPPSLYFVINNFFFIVALKLLLCMELARMTGQFCIIVFLAMTKYVLREPLYNYVIGRDKWKGCLITMNSLERNREIAFVMLWSLCLFVCFSVSPECEIAT